MTKNTKAWQKCIFLNPPSTREDVTSPRSTKHYIQTDIYAHTCLGDYLCVKVSLLKMQPLLFTFSVTVNEEMFFNAFILAAFDNPSFCR